MSGQGDARDVGEGDAFPFRYYWRWSGGNEVQFVEWLQKMVTEYNMPHSTTPRFTRFHVLVREDVIQD